MARARREVDEIDKQVKLSKENWKEAIGIFRFIKPYRGYFILGLVMILFSSLTTLSFPYFLKKLIDSAQAIKDGKASISPNTIALWMFGALILQMIFSYGRVYFFAFAGEHALSDIRKEVYNRMVQLPMDFFAQRRVGELSSRISADLSQIQDAITILLAEILRGALTLVVGIGLILYISPKLTLVMLSVIPVIIVIAVFFGKRIRKLSKAAQDQLADSNTVVQETLQGITNVKAFSNEWFEISRYSNSLNKVVELAVKNGINRGAFVSFLLFSLFGSIIFVVWFGLKMLDVSDLTAFVLYTSFVGGSMAGFADVYGQLQKTLGATQRVRELMREEIEVVNINREPLLDEYRLTGRVVFDHVRFSYPSRPEVMVLKDASLESAPGQQIALVGPSGAGKSTIVSLLLGFYKPDGGKILFDGKEASTIPLSQLRQQMAIVPQDVMLFGGTIRENIAYGKPDATDEEIQAAAAKANAHEFVSQFPEGYQTIVGERGIKLSGGQRQRIAIARAILKDPVILILDEATSSLDSASEALVQDALEKLMQNRTSFVIAHRLSTVRNADCIYVLDKGVVSEQGTHEELIQVTDGLYKSLSKLQLSH